MTCFSKNLQKAYPHSKTSQKAYQYGTGTRRNITKGIPTLPKTFQMTYRYRDSPKACLPTQCLYRMRRTTPTGERLLTRNVRTSSFLYLFSVFRIHSLNPDPAKNLNPDPDPVPDPDSSYRYFLPLSEFFLNYFIIIRFSYQKKSIE